MDAAFNASLVNTNCNRFWIPCPDARIEGLDELIEMNLFSADDMWWKKSKSLSEMLYSLLDRSIELKVAQQLANSDIERMLSIGDDVKGLQSLQMGLKFFVNVIDDAEFFEDAAICFQEAEGLRYLNHYVIFQEGCVYLFSEKKRDLNKAAEYFEKTARFARVDPNPPAIALSELFASGINEYASLNSDAARIQSFASRSYSNAALVRYLQEQFAQAVSLQEKAYSLFPSSENALYLAKFYVRNNQEEKAIRIISEVIEDDPSYVYAICGDPDLLSVKRCIQIVNNKVESVDNQVLDLWEEFSETPSPESYFYLTQLYNAVRLEDKMSLIKKLTK